MLLAGGGASRLGGADKPGLVVGGRTLLASVVAAAASAGARRIVVVGPARPELPDGLTFVREDPPGSGPVPALRRGLAEVSAPTVAVLAADLPFLRARHLRTVLARCVSSTSGVIMVDDTGRPQWLAGCWRTAVLRVALRAYAGASLHGLLGPLEPTLLSPALPGLAGAGLAGAGLAGAGLAGAGPARAGPAGGGYDLAAGDPPPWLDCDTADDLARARAWKSDMQQADTRPRETQ